jgi:hypothetical protein
MPTPSLRRSLARIQQAFLVALPRIEAHGNVYFRNVKCASTKEERLAEMVAVSWMWWLRLHHKGKDPSQFVSAIASYAARAVRSGRRVCGMEKAKDVMSPRAQQLRGFTVGKLPDFSTLSSNPLTEALTDNTQTPPDEQMCFRIDFPAWLASLGDRKRRIAEDLMVGERTMDVANRHGLTQGRISQMRREFRDDWTLFCGESLC